MKTDRTSNMYLAKLPHKILNFKLLHSSSKVIRSIRTRTGNSFLFSILFSTNLQKIPHHFSKNDRTSNMYFAKLPHRILNFELLHSSSNVVRSIRNRTGNSFFERYFPQIFKTFLNTFWNHAYCSSDCSELKLHLQIQS